MLTDSGRAIGAVTKLLHDRLVAAGLGVADVSVGRPEPPAGAPAPRVNLFLYELRFDASLRNHPLDVGQAAPVWLILHYLATAFDEDGESDTIDAHALLGGAIRCLHGLNFLDPAGLPAIFAAALDDSPEPLKLTFNEAGSELLSRLMQGSDEKYRCSVAFEVRPIMIAPAAVPSYALLVGVDSEHGTVIGEAGIRIPVLPSLGPVLADAFPTAVDTGETLTLTGTDLALDGLSVRFGPVELPIVAQRPGSLRCTVDGGLAGGTAGSAGAQLVTVAQALPGGRSRASNPLVVNLRPALATASAVNIVAAAGGTVTGAVDLAGTLLGGSADDVVVALYRDGATVRAFDAFTVPPGPPPAPQTRLRLTIPAAEPIAAGSYRVILRVNGVQARTSPSVDLTPP